MRTRRITSDAMRSNMRCCNNESRVDVNQVLGVRAQHSDNSAQTGSTTHAGLGRRSQTHRIKRHAQAVARAAQVESAAVPGQEHASRPARARFQRCRSAAAAPSGAARARQRRRQAHHQRPDRRQPAGAVQVQVGLGEVPLHLRQPLDAARGQHVARHRDLEGPERPDRRRAPHHQAQPRLLRHGRFAGGQQHRAGHLPPHHGARVPPVPAAPGLRRSDPHPRLPVHRRVAGPGRRRDLQRLPRGAVDPRQGRVPDPVHRRDHGSRTSRPARPRTTRRCSRA
jgi:hypothetical protein